jgi:hypothetical protein
MANAPRPVAVAPTGFLSSPRNQRRILVGSAVIFVIGLVAFISLVLLRGTSNAFNSPISNQPAQLLHKEKPVPPSKAALTVARTFMETAVARKNLDYAYTLVHPDLRGRMTRKQWDTGDIPVIGYPANNFDTASFQVDFSYPTSMLLEVDLVAKPGSNVRPHLPFFIGLKKVHGAWLVNYWEPHWRPPIPSAP